MVDSTRDLWLQGRGHARVQFDAATVERERHDVVVADGEDHVEQLLFGEPRGQRLPRRFADLGVVVQLVGGRSRAASWTLQSPSAIGSLVRCTSSVTDLAAERDQCVLAELVLRCTTPSGSQDQQLAIARCQRVLGKHVRSEHKPTSQQCGMMGQGAEDVQRRSVGGAQAGLVVQLGHLGGRIGHWRDARRVHGVIMSRRQNADVIEPGCPFCDAIAGASPVRAVLNDDVAIAFLDRSPVFKGHVLIAPKQHTVTLADLDHALVGPLFERVQRVSARMPAALGCDGTFVAINNVVSQSVAHLHVHVVPRRRKDGLRGFFWPRVKYESDAEADDYARRLSDALAE